MKEKLPEGFKKFLLKSGVFLILFILIQIFTMWAVAETRLPKEIKPFSMSDLAKAAGFMLVLFIGLNRKKILKIKDFPVSLMERGVGAICIILGFSIYFPYKVLMLDHIELVKEYLYLFVFGEYLILFSILLSLILIVYGSKFIFYFVKEFWKGLIFVIFGTIVTYHFILRFQKLWLFFSDVVARSVLFLLDFISPATLVYVKNYPVISFSGFMAGIAEPCSGIDSFLLFSFLFLGIVAWEWGNFDRKKVVFLYFVGVIITFLLNIFRIFLLFLIGAYISRSFALNVFHTNASSILFLIFFAIFWKVSYKWFKK